MRGHGGDAAHQVVGRDVVLVVLGAEALGGDARELHLVVALGLEADRVGGRRPAGHLADHAGHGGAVGAAAQEARRLAAVELRGHGVAHQLAEFGGEGREFRVARLREAGHPVGRDGEPAAFEQRAVRRRQAVHALEDGARRRDDVEVQVVEDRLRVDGCPGRQRGEFVGAGGEVQLPVDDAVAQRADREAVHGQEGAAGAVAEAHRKVAVGAGRGRRGALCQRRLPRGRIALRARQAGQPGVPESRGAQRQRALGETCGRREGGFAHGRQECSAGPVAAVWRVSAASPAQHLVADATGLHGAAWPSGAVVLRGFGGFSLRFGLPDRGRAAVGATVRTGSLELLRVGSGGLYRELDAQRAGHVTKGEEQQVGIVGLQRGGVDAVALADEGL